MNYIEKLKMQNKRYILLVLLLVIVIGLSIFFVLGNRNQFKSDFVEKETVYPMEYSSSYEEGAEGGNAATTYQEESADAFFDRKVSCAVLGEVLSTENVLKKNVSYESGLEYYAISLIKLKVLKSFLGDSNKGDIVYMTYPHMISESDDIAAGAKGIFLPETPKQSLTVKGTSAQYETLGNLSYGTNRICLSTQDTKVSNIDSMKELKEYWTENDWVTK